MNQNSPLERPSLSRLRPHLLFVLGFLVLAGIYFIPAFQGKELPMQDIRQSYASTIELREFKKQTGEFPLWTNALFSGMPAYMIAFDYPYTFVGRTVESVLNLIPRPVNLLFVTMVSMYLLLLVIGRTDPEDASPDKPAARRWLAATGAVAYAFGTYLMLTVEAGHVSKVWAMAYAPGVLAGVIQTLRGKYWAGAALTAFFACMELNANHLQITYYLFILVAIYVLMEGIALVRMGKAKQLALGLAFLAVAGGLGAASFSKRLLVLNQYQKETIRGRSELTAKTTAQTADSTTAAAASASGSKDGLDKDYAFNWSYGKAEALNLLIPNFFGGGSGGGLDEGSEFYKALVNKGVDPGAARQFVELGAPTYWGDQPGVGGPSYAGAVLLFLFVLGLTLSTHRIRWYLLVGALLMIAIAMGKNLLVINGPLFDYFPLFNKFRAVTMTMGLAQLFFAGGAVLGIHAIVSRNLSADQLKKPLAISVGLTAGLALVLALLGSVFFSFQTTNDIPVLMQYFGDQAMASDMQRALISDRQSMARADAFRSVIFILLAAGAIYGFALKKLKAGVFFPVLLALMVFDLYMVDKRFLNNGNFIPKTQVNAAFEETPADAQILGDKSLSYRVWDQTGSFMNDNRTSFFHKSIGGYHAAKLRRYQELIEYAFPKNTLNILNMLNGKYAIMQPQPDPANPQQQPSAPVAQPNPEALGNAWFVRTVVQVPDADAEMAAVQTFNPRDSVVVDKRFAEQLNGLPALDPTGATIRLTNYIPDHLTYESNAPTEQLAVFSEIYYRGDTDWNAYIDGKKVPHLRANYVLRAMRVPAGKHTIEFKFEPPVVALGDTLDAVFNGLLIAFIALAIFLSLRKPKAVTV
ncbi:hypothetical protein [Rudanella lutea]|uniref:hypothetical protein n=1 Tax=Rudanella lutea TaxID=451374 RepID=UPI0005C5F81F|nr:hypothetical protein [Rudanella lutea]